MTAFDTDLLEIAGREREIDLTTWGRKTGNPSRVIIWIFRDGERLFVRSGGGLGRDWPRNLIARNGSAILHAGGRDVPVVARHVTDPELARHISGIALAKYQSDVQRSTGDEPLTPGESATFELFPDPARA